MESPISVLQGTFGLPAFRQGQEQVITRLLAGRSVLAIFPTGAGKSLCYQLPALMLEGVTLVVSPLIALMKDQIDFLHSRQVAAARLDSTLSAEEALKTYADLRSGALKLLFIAPERLANERFIQTLKRQKIAMLAVDEAHCISEWGHNFRPDYMKLAGLARSLGVQRVLALTATATAPVARAIASSFSIAPDDVVQTKFHRENLHLQVTPTHGGDHRRELLLRAIQARPAAPTIVYVTLQKTAEELAGYLGLAGLAAQAYHAGLESQERHAIQDWFMQSPDAVVVATIAFGMGIDKRDIRYVYHYNLPKSMENYAQEIGRAGRDGKPATCHLLPAMDDLTTLENFAFGDTPTSRAIAFLLERLLASRDAEFDVSVYELSNLADIRPLVVETLLTYLELDGVIESTGPFYGEYKYQANEPMEKVFAKFDAERADFLRRIFAQAEHAKVWSTLRLDAVAQALHEPRQRVVAALNFLETQGTLKLQATGLRQGYRLRQKELNTASLARALVRRFNEREHRDIDRLRQMLKFVDHDGCRTQFLLHYFGEALHGPCGHCDWCAGERPGAMPPADATPLGEKEVQALAELHREQHAALKTVRQVARFLCGIRSPATTRARLTKHIYFGLLAHAQFQQVFAFVQEHAAAINQTPAEPRERGKA